MFSLAKRYVQSSVKSNEATVKAIVRGNICELNEIESKFKFSPNSHIDTPLADDRKWLKFIREHDSFDLLTMEKEPPSRVDQLELEHNSRDKKGLYDRNADSNLQANTRSSID